MSQPNTTYVGDVACLPLDDRKSPCPAAVIGLASRRPADRALADHIRTELVTDAPAAAGRCRGSLAGAVLHTDHSARCTSRAFTGACRRAGRRQPMGPIGSGADNVLAESFSATFKRETLQGRRHWSSAREARLDALLRLRRYNTRHRHSRLGHRSPIVHEAASRTASTTLTPAA